MAAFGLLYCLTFIGAIAGSSASPVLRHRAGLSPRGTYLAGMGLETGCGLFLLGLSFSPLMASPSAASEVLLQLATGLYVFGRAICMVQSQVQALEPFPTRAASAAGLMGAMRSTGVAAVSSLAGSLLSFGRSA